VIYPRAVRWFVEGRLALQGLRVTLAPPEPQWFFFEDIEQQADSGAAAEEA